MPRRGAGHAFGSEAFGIGAEQHGADRHAGALVVALRESVDRERLRVNSVQAMLGRFLREALGHALEQMMAAVSGKHDSLAPFGHQRSRLALECDMADHLAAAVARHRRNKLAALDFVPVAARREHLGVHVVMTIDFEEAAGDCRRIAFLRQIDDIVACWRRYRRRG